MFYFDNKLTNIIGEETWVFSSVETVQSMFRACTALETLDVTNLVRLSRSKGVKFNMLLDWCIGKAAAGIKEFYLLPVGEKLMAYDSIAVNAIVKDCGELGKRSGLTYDDIAYIVPHQANMRIIDFASRKLKVPMEKFSVNIDRFGNTSSASIPMMLDELNRAGKLKRGDLLLLPAFGGGLASACCLLKW